MFIALKYDENTRLWLNTERTIPVYQNELYFGTCSDKLMSESAPVSVSEHIHYQILLQH